MTLYKHIRGCHLNGIYLHIPFCRSICSFCSFPVLQSKPHKHFSYLELVKKEASLLNHHFAPDFNSVSSVYFGGGTPSALPIEILNSLISILKPKIQHSSCQWSIEINPEDSCIDYLKFLLQSGFNRFSIGIQTFNDRLLQKISRKHTVKQNRKVLEDINKLGIKDYNIDIIYGIPGQTLDYLQHDIDTAISYQPSHVSAYILNIEPKTKLYRQPYWIKWQNRREMQISEMYQLITSQLQNYGLHHYEVSNYAKPGFESKQNLINWNGLNFLGIGLGAHSYVDGYRFGNHRRMKEYREGIEQEKLPYEFFDHLNHIERRDEYIMIRLRLAEGLSFEAFKTDFGYDLLPFIADLLHHLKVKKLIKPSKTHIKLTTSGLLLADEIVLKICSQLPEK